jgi:hypothetical protein
MLDILPLRQARPTLFPSSDCRLLQPVVPTLACGRLVLRGLCRAAPLRTVQRER